jgi:hypothetical protein
VAASYRHFRIIAALLCFTGFCTCFAAYYPGLLSPDSMAMYMQAHRLAFSDWYAPLLAMIWAGICFAVPGPEGMLFFLLAFYWGALFLLADAAITIERYAAFAMPILGVMPFAVNFAGTTWTDVLVAVIWLMCVAVVFHSRVYNRTMPAITQVVAWILFICGSWARANALFAAVPLGFYVLGPQQARSFLKRAALSATFIVGLWGGSQLVFYGVFKVQRSYPINSILVFDLAGITHFTGKNQFPMQWSEQETANIISCYDPTVWDPYNPRGECSFVFRKIVDGDLWESSALWRPWFVAVFSHPLSYLHHRSAYFFKFMTAKSSYFFHQGNTSFEISRHLQQNAAFAIVRDYVFFAARLGIFRPIFWLALGCLLLPAAQLCPEPSRSLVKTLALSSIVYLGTYFFVGVASDFRYAYWGILASSVAALVLACELSAGRCLPGSPGNGSVARGFQRFQ